ncbi:MAG: hypothetical protein WBY94_22810 [Polyangiaceae bacterium]
MNGYAVSQRLQLNESATSRSVPSAQRGQDNPAVMEGENGIGGSGYVKLATQPVGQ